jgi:serine/threonine-protein kinase
MNQERWDSVADVFWAALDRPAQERTAFVRATCPEPSLRDEVLAMLAAHDDPSGLRVERRFLPEDGERDGGLEPGTRIGPWRIVALAGRGGMGEVYRAERADGEFEQVVALKLLRPDARTVDLARRFRAERAVLARLAHPNIATVLDGGTAPDGRPYFALRFIEGETITRHASRLPIRVRVRLFIKVCLAVQVAHKHLIVHRDIKPSNILVGADGEPVLLDFGIAKLLDAGDEQTGTGRALLTPSHAAPEQVRGEPVTTATDVYGLGALLFEMLTGNRLFLHRTSAAALERAILENNVPLPSSAASDPAMGRELRGDLDRIIQMALRKEPERRYASVADFAGDLERWLSARPVLAQPDRWAYRAARFVRRNRAGVTAAAVAGLVLAGVAVREVGRARAIAAERDRALREQAAGEDVLAFVTNLFEQSNPGVVPGGDTLRVGAFLDLAEQRVATLHDHPEQQMRVYRVLGNVRTSRGDYAAAESLLTLSRDIGVKALGADHLEVLRTERLLGVLLDEYRGEIVAVPVLERAVRRLQQTVGPDHPDLAAAYGELAAAVAAPDSIHLLVDSVVAVRTRLGTLDSLQIADLLDAQAREQGIRGQYANAVAFEEAALRIVEHRLPSTHPRTLTLKGNLAVWLNGMGRWDRAVPLAEDVLTAARDEERPGEGLAIATERVALLRANLPGGPALAEPGIREALGLFREHVAPEHILITSSMRNLAIVMSHQGREEEGLVLLDSAIARNRAAGYHDAALYLVGQKVPMLIRLGRVAEALRDARAAAESRARLPRGSTYGADLAYWLGLASLASGRTADAVTHLGAATDSIATKYPRGHPRAAMTACAFGVALARAGRDAPARAQLGEACPRLDGWGLADPTVVGWAQREASRLRAVRGNLPDAAR